MRFDRARGCSGVLVTALLLLVPSGAAAEVSLTLADGRVTVVARNATVRQVLAEWARVGGTRIVNLERVGGAPDSFELRNVPESKALAVILRSVAGYIAAPRPASSIGASIYDRILILPTSVASAPVGPLRAGPTPPAPVYELPAPDPTGLANDETAETPAGAPAALYQGNGPGPEQATPAAPGGPPPVLSTPGVTPYTPAPADPGATPAGQPTGPSQTPNAGQFVAPKPGVLPTPSPTQQQPKP